MDGKGGTGGIFEAFVLPFQILKNPLEDFFFASEEVVLLCIGGDLVIDPKAFLVIEKDCRY